ncbi:MULTISPECIES: transcriptional regulator YeiL [Listeria]|uniref:transcriptional regulator YeiL n=1 Tax=Listeria TaxID=1637 RepID=UPI000B593D9C|nr:MULTISPECIES: transcriptional regulator YeiL [Listeria]
MKKITKPHQISEAIKKSELEASFPDEMFAKLELYTVKKNEFIVNQSNPPEKLFLLVSGKAKIKMTLENGKVSLVDFISAPSYIGELTLLGVEETPKDVIAHTNCALLALPLKENQAPLLENPTFMKNLAIFLGKKALHRTETLTESLNLPFSTRLARFILLTEENGVYYEKHTEVAEYLHVSYRHLLYVLHDLTQKGILEKVGRRYKIINRDALAKL